MATAKPKTIVTYKMTGDAVSHARTDVEIRDVDMTIDEPLERGGTNMGLTPTEVLVAALIGCTNVIGQRVGETHGVHFEDFAIEAAADFDRRGVMMQEEVDVPFPKIVLTISGKSTADDAALKKVKTDLGRVCPIAKGIRQSGTEIEEIWNITRT